MAGPCSAGLEIGQRPGRKGSTPFRPPSSEDEIGRGDRADAGKRDSEIGDTVAGHIGIDDDAGAGGRIAQIAGMVAEGRRTDEVGSPDLDCDNAGIDLRQIDRVALRVIEVGDGVVELLAVGWNSKPVDERRACTGKYRPEPQNCRRRCRRSVVTSSPVP